MLGATALLGIAAGTAFAADLTRKLSTGASLGDVVGIWGEPTEKIEKDLKHEVVWYYPQGARVTFKNGKVSSWRPPDSIVEAQAGKAATVVATPMSEQVAKETQDLVRDIAKEVPSAPDAPYVEPPQVPGQPQALPNAPAPIRGAPPAMAPEVDLSDEVD